MGLPRYGQVIHPGQSAQISTGWSLTAIPAGSVLQLFPHSILLRNNLIAMPQSYGVNDIGS